MTNGKLKRHLAFSIGHWSLNGAYTLIEVLVSLTITGLIFSFGYVSFREFSRRQALTGAVRSVQGDLRLAQAYALSGKKPEGVYCDSPNRLDFVSFRVDSATSYTILAECTAGNINIKAVSLPAGVTMTTPNPNPIRYKVLGQGTNISASTLTITLTHANTGNRQDVTIGSGGEVR